MRQTMPEKRGLPLDNPPLEKALTIAKPLESFTPEQIDRIERKGVMRRGGKSERGRGEKGVVIFAMLRCWSCRLSSPVSFYSDDPPPYVKCQGCNQIYPFDSFGCWCHSNEPI